MRRSSVQSINKVEAPKITASHPYETFTAKVEIAKLFSSTVSSTSHKFVENRLKRKADQCFKQEWRHIFIYVSVIRFPFIRKKRNKSKFKLIFPTQCLQLTAVPLPHLNLYTGSQSLSQSFCKCLDFCHKCKH